VDTIDDVLARSDPVLRWYLAGIRLNPRFHVRFVSCVVYLLLAAVMFVIFWIITACEGRFGIDSRNLPLAPGSRDLIVGLSFLGDSMVWPFLFLVPIYLLLLKNASAGVAVLFRDSENLLRQNVLNSPARRAEFETIRDRAVAVLCYRGPISRWLWRGALVLGVGVFAFNFIVCVRADAWPNRLILYDHLPLWLKPYELNKPVIIPDMVMIALKEPAPLITPCINQNTSCLPPDLAGKLNIDPDRRTITWAGPLTSDDRSELAALWPGTDWQQVVRSLATLKSNGVPGEISRPFEKWDTDPYSAPWSWFATRIWVLVLGYTILPLAVLRVLNFLFVIWRFVSGMAEANMLKANPYVAGSRDSLRLIVNAFFAANYCLLVASVMFALGFFKVGSKPGWQDLALVVLIPGFAFAAIAPLLFVSNAIERHVKSAYLSVHAEAAARLHQGFHDAAARGQATDPVAWIDANTKYDDYLSRGEATAIFPLSASTITKLLAPVTPLILAVAEKAAEQFF
jgi:hypothetical protein